MKHWRIGGLALMLTTGSALAQLQGPGLSVPLDTEHAVELSPGIGLRGWIGGRPGLLASDGLVASSMVLADWHPLSNGFRLSGGLAYGSLRLEPLATSGFGSERYLRDPGFECCGSGSPFMAGARQSLPRPGLGPGHRLTQPSVLQRRSWGDVSAQQPVDLGLSRRVSRPRSADRMCARWMPHPGLDDARFAPMMSLGVGLRF